MEDSSAAQELIERAFGLARQSGKPEWWIMAVPVLKNRLLQLTKGSFKESDFGATSFWDFLHKNAGAVRVDDSSPPGLVILKSAEGEGQPGLSHLAHRRGQIRPDLWRAVLDYSSGHRFEWNAASGTAQPAPTESQGPFLPTVSPEELKQWRIDFLNQRAAADEPSDQVKAWVEKGLTTAALPAIMRPAWNKFLKRRTQERLNEWFDANDIARPSITENVNFGVSHSREPNLLRAFVLECVRLMSNEELEKLPIPSSVALRAKSTL